ncbi:MAG: NAD+ synthase, partial [Robiginitomaculum sp.]|nr:NAD+ synthase [Robiginitomaculum sp.]
KIASAQLNPTVGDLAGNMTKARKAYARAKDEGADILVLPELFVIGYPPEDLVLKPAAVADCRVEAETFAKITKNGPAVIFSTPWLYRGKLYSAVLVMRDGKITDKRFKHRLPNYGVFDEIRVFKAGPLPKPVEIRGIKIGLPICEDIWHAGVAKHLADHGAEILISPNGSPYRRTARDERLHVVQDRIERAGLPLVYVNQVGGQDELVFDGSSFSMTADDKVRQFLPSFEEAFEVATWTKQNDEWTCKSETNLPQFNQMEADWRAMCLGLGDYVNKNGFKQIILGMSGGVDSAMAAAIAVDALGADRVWCVMMPSKYTSNNSLEDAKACAERLGCKYDIIAIPPAVEAFGDMLSGHFEDTTPDTTEENIQSRIRAVSLMALSNKFGPMVVTTGNKSEMAVGYATLYGDMCGGFNPLKDIYKTEVYDLVRWRNDNHPEGLLGPASPIPNRIITKAPSAELRPDQTDQDSLPEYEVLDDILECLVEQELPVNEIVARGHPGDLVKRIEHLLYVAEYKRRQAAPGVKITARNFGRDRRYPITNGYRDTR